MYKLYIPELIPRVQLVPFLAGNTQSNKLFQAIPQEAYDGIVNRVSNIGEADAVLAPHEFVNLSAHPAYFRRYREQAERAGIPLIISAYQDDPTPLTVPHAIVLRPSAFRSRLTSAEILMPAYVEDVGAARRTPLRKEGIPRVSFMGKADFATALECAHYLIRNYVVRRGPLRQGMYFRRIALAGLSRDHRVQLSAVLRKRYSAHRHTIELSPEVARKQYLDSIDESHFTLAPSGDGNYSLRFYETLAMGRIPVLIDTDVPLPLEDVIDYERCVVKVPWREARRAGDYIVRFWNERTPEEFEAAGEYARHIFETHLYMPRFLRDLFGRVLPSREAR